MKKLLLIITVLASGYNSFGQLNLYSASDDVLSFSYDSQGSTKYMTLEKVVSANACGTANEIKVNYSSPGNGSYWAGNGAYNVNGWGSNQLDFSLYTDIEFKVKYTGSNPQNELNIILEDSTTPTAGKTTPILVSGTESAACISKKISLASIKGSIDYKKVQQIVINIGNFQWDPTPALAGSGSGTFYIDEIKLTGGALGVPDFNLDSSIGVYPNPSNGIYNITTAGNIASVSVTNIYGAVVFEGKGNTVNLTNHSQGVYFARIVTDNNTVLTQRLVKN